MINDISNLILDNHIKTHFYLKMVLILNYIYDIDFLFF